MKKILIGLLLLTKLHSEVIPGSEEALLGSILSNLISIRINTNATQQQLREIKPEIIMIKKLNHKQLKVQARMLVEMEKQSALLERILKSLNN